MSEQATETTTEASPSPSRSLSLRGFFLGLRVPSEENLIVEVDCTGMAGEAYLKLIRELQDCLSTIDEAFAKRKPRGRSLKGRYSKRNEGTRVIRQRHMRFSPYPSQFSNTLRTLRADVYNLLHKTCLTLQVLELGMHRRNVYLLPESGTAPLFTAIRALNGTIHALNERLKTYSVEPIKTILDQYRLKPKTSVTPEIPDIMIDLTLVDLSPQLVNRWVNRDPEVAQLLRQKRSNLITKAVTDIKTRIENALGRITGALTAKSRKREIESSKKNLMKLNELCESVGLQALSDQIIKPLLQRVGTLRNGNHFDPSFTQMDDMNARVRAMLSSL